MSTLIWIKNKVWWVLGGLLLLLGAIFAVKYEREKLRTYKNKKEAIKHLGAAESLRDHASEYEDKDKELVATEQESDKVVGDIDARMKEVEHEVHKRDAKAVADRFNDLATEWTDPE